MSASILDFHSERLRRLIDQCSGPRWLTRQLITELLENGASTFPEVIHPIECELMIQWRNAPRSRERAISEDFAQRFAFSGGSHAFNNGGVLFGILEDLK